MRILVAPGPFKESLAADRAASAMAKGLRVVFPSATIRELPLSDGGTGLTDRLVAAQGGTVEILSVRGPCGDPVQGKVGRLADGTTVVIESASACGLALVPSSQRDPLKTSTIGVGELIHEALARYQPKDVIIGCGDSATNDGGLGAAQALGVSFRRQDGTDLPYGAGGGALQSIAAIDSESMIPLGDTTFTVACNLSSILCGPEGTSRVYGPQKGATPAAVVELEAGLCHWADLLQPISSLDLRYLPGAGGSGGLASALVTFLRARLLFSFDVVAAFIDIDGALEGSDIVFTGEGALDDRTASGKLVCSLALRAKRFGLPVVAIVGNLAAKSEEIFYNGLDAAFSIAPGPMSLEHSIRDAEALLEAAATLAGRSIRCGAGVAVGD